MLVLKIVIFIAGVTLVAQSLYSQENPHPFAHYNLNNGLAAYNSNTIVQDREGFMWIGTINGLQRFDGHRFLTFRRIPGDKNSLSDNYIDHLFYDSKGNLWLVLGNGELGVFDTRRFTYRAVPLKVKDDRIVRMPRRLFEDSDGNILYVIDGQEVATYNSMLREFSATHNKLRLPGDRKALSIVEDFRTKKYWIATDSGMCVFNTRNRLLSYKGHNSEKIPFIDKYSSGARFKNLMIDSMSRFWFTTRDATGATALNCYDLVNDTLILNQQYLLPNMQNYEIKRILKQNDGNIWIGGLNVFMKYNPRENKFLPASGGNIQNHINYQEVNCLFEDREKNIWLSTDNNGLYVFRPSARLFKSAKHINRSSGKMDEGGVITLSFNHKNEILAAVWGDGIHKYDPDLNPLPEKNHSPGEKSPILFGVCAGLMIKGLSGWVCNPVSSCMMPLVDGRITTIRGCLKTNLSAP